MNARTGQVFGYEALMRPRLTSLETPLEVLSLAKSQGKLYQIERLTWFLALKSFTGFKNIPPDCRLFINSIANQGFPSPMKRRWRLSTDLTSAVW